MGTAEGFQLKRDPNFIKTILLPLYAIFMPAMAASSTTGLSFFWLELGNRMGNRNKFELFPMGWLPAVDSIFNGLLCLRAFAKLRGERPDDVIGFAALGLTCQIDDVVTQRLGLRVLGRGSRAWGSGFSLPFWQHTSGFRVLGADA